MNRPLKNPAQRLLGLLLSTVFVLALFTVTAEPAAANNGCSGTAGLGSGSTCSLPGGGGLPSRPSKGSGSTGPRSPEVTSGTFWSGDDSGVNMRKAHCPQRTVVLAGKSLAIFAIGAGWTRTRYFKVLSGGRQITTGDSGYVYHCIYPSPPVVVTRYCPTSAGPGILDGPTGTGLPVSNGPNAGDVVVNSTERTWSAVSQTSPIGYAYNNYRTSLSNNPDTALSLIRNCGQINYSFHVSSTSCRDMGGNQLSGTQNCSVTPGNYHTMAKTKQIRCHYAYYPDTGTRVFLDCSQQFQCGSDSCTYDANQAFYCDGSVANNFDFTYNFGTCDGAYGQPVCVWAGGGLSTIVDPYGNVIQSGAEVGADGKQWSVTWPAVTSVGAENEWQQWVVAGGSQPVRNGVDVGDPSQQVFGQYVKSVSDLTGSSILASAGTSRGITGWNIHKLFLQFFQATPANLRHPITVGAGETATPIVVLTNDMIPYAIYAKFNFSVTRMATTAIGGPVAIQVPMSCSSPLTSFYPVSGRVAG